MRMLRFSFLFVCLIFSGNFLTGQAVDNLKNEREKLLKDIESASRQLSSKRTTRENTYQQLNLISQEILIREQLLFSLEQEISLIDQSIENNQLKINNLEVEIILLRQEYAKLLQDTYKRRNSLDELSFFMSSEGVAEAYQRYRLLKEYSRYRQSQAQNLIDAQDQLKALLVNIQSQRQQKEQSLNNLAQENRRLNNNRTEKNRLVQSLQQEEQWLAKQIKDKESKAKELENKILELIRTAAVGTVGTDFKDLAGKLMWPVKNGIVVSKFGEHEHPVLKNVTIKNNGLDIQSIGSDDVFLIHTGEVSRVIGIPGYNTAVIVRHGSFFTVYANLKSVVVTQGQKLSTGAKIGTIYKENNEESGVLHFEIWNENNKLNPALWLRK